MNYFRVRLELESPLGTPLHSGTLFGHLCWARRYLEGEVELVRWLDSLEAGELFLISSGFPAGWLPRPLLAPARGRVQSKKARRRTLMRLEDFLRLRTALSARALEALEQCRPDAPEVVALTEERLAHNTIDRRLGTTPEEGGLYFVDEWWPRGACVWDVYVAAAIGGAGLTALFETVGRLGYGRDASIGRGRFTARLEPAPDELFGEQGGRRMSLSHGSLTPNMLEPRYRLEPLAGKLGPAAAAEAGDHPFKYPVLLLRPGATFRPADGGPYGELLGGLHPKAPWVRQNAWHLTVAFHEQEE